MSDQQGDQAKEPGVTADPDSGTNAENEFENEGGGNQTTPRSAPTSLKGKVEQAVQALRGMFGGAGKGR